MDLFLGGLLCLFCGMAFMISGAEALPALAVGGKWKSAAMGMGITALLQSSSAVSCAVCAMRQKGLLDKTGSKALLVGANIGTTVTPFLTAAGLGLTDQIAVVVPLIGLGALLLKSKLPHASGPITGLSLLLWGLSLLAKGAPELIASLDVERLRALLESPLPSFFAGLLVTALLQSSAVSIGLLQMLSLSMPLSQAAVIPFLLGQNIGTTTTALLATFGAGKTARSCALFHFRLNVAGALWCLPLSVLAAKLLTAPATPLFMALFHLAFNTANGLLHLALMRP